jgi:hypothetical protein
MINLPDREYMGASALPQAKYSRSGNIWLKGAWDRGNFPFGKIGNSALGSFFIA